jgi:type VI secretion system protein ImpF
MPSMKAEQDRYRVPLLHCFRDAYGRGDAKKELRQSSDGDQVLSAAASLRRRGLSEAEIRQSVMESLVDIVNTIDLQSAVDLDGLEYASKSILNYGIYDVSHLTSEDAGIAAVEQNMIAALLCYEPRIRRETLQITREVRFDDVAQKLLLSVYAEISYQPLDIPLEFFAEIDLGSSKIIVSKA